jgi:hypothetical protein
VTVEAKVDVWDTSVGVEAETLGEVRVNEDVADVIVGVNVKEVAL